MSAIIAGCALAACSSAKQAVDSGVRQDSAPAADAPLVPPGEVAVADVASDRQDGAATDAPGSGIDALEDLGSDVREDSQIVADATDARRDEGTDGGRDAGPEAGGDDAGREAGADQAVGDGAGREAVADQAVADAGRVDAVVVDGGSEVIACVAPACCLSANLKPEDMWIDAAGSELAISMLVTLSGANSQTWGVTADVSVPGGQATCNTGMVVASFSYVLLKCPVIVLDPMPVCGSPMTIKVRLGTSTYSPTGSGDVVCAGDQSVEVERQLPVLCPVCPAADGIERSSCQMVGQNCSYDVGSPSEALCKCIVVYSTGERIWTCMIM